MRIVSWNIRAGGGRRVEQIAAQIQRWKPDIVGLQEFRATPPSRTLAAALREQGLVHQRSTASNAHPASNRLLVASRWPLRLANMRRAPVEPGRWLLVRVAAAHPSAMAVMHVPNRVTRRKYPYLDAVLELARAWRGGPALLMGDTNSGWIDLDEEVPAFNRREDGWMTALEKAGWRDGFRLLHGGRREYTWYSPNGRNGFRLDEAFLNRPLAQRLTEVRYEWGSSTSNATRRDALSDHAALIVDLDLNRDV